MSSDASNCSDTRSRNRNFLDLQQRSKLERQSMSLNEAVSTFVPCTLLTSVSTASGVNLPMSVPSLSLRLSSIELRASLPTDEPCEFFP